ncbi:hypothetical protein [Polaromonas aquatica]|uniref:hypothetical protein n=1 Tax=Polaromonas aquatica TaxID=332657 RepID=UPI003D6490CC
MKIYKTIGSLLLIASSAASQAQNDKWHTDVHRCPNHSHWLLVSWTDGVAGGEVKNRIVLNSVVDIGKIIGPQWKVIARTCTSNGFSFDTRAASDAKRSRQIEIRLLTPEKDKFEVWYKDKEPLSFSYKRWPIDKQMTL